MVHLGALLAFGFDLPKQLSRRKTGAQFPHGFLQPPTTTKNFIWLYVREVDEPDFTQRDRRARHQVCGGLDGRECMVRKAEGGERRRALTQRGAEERSAQRDRGARHQVSTRFPGFIPMK